MKRARLALWAAGATAAQAMYTSLAAAAPAMGVEDIRDIRAPLLFPPWWTWPLAIGVAALLASAVLLLLRWWRRRRARAATPLERARAALDAAEAHAREGRAHEWAELVAETLRSALAVRLGTSVLPRTTSELAKMAWASADPPIVATPEAVETPKGAEKKRLDASVVLELLEVCDLARFARARLDPAPLLARTAVARALVEQLFEPQAAPAVATAAPQALVTP